MKQIDYQGFELGPIRPPSEAYSLLVRINRGCGWNKCRFCGFYRDTPFSPRPAEDIMKDIDLIKEWLDIFQGKAPGRDPRDDGDREACYMAYHWLQAGLRNVFFQDANSILMQPQGLLRVLDHLNILKLMNKGVTKQVQIEAGIKAMSAGIEINEFYMPGMGGREYARASALDTADVMNQVNPDFIRIRSMALSDKLEMYEDYEKGILTRPNDIETIHEIRLFIESLGDITSVVDSDHILNILLELKGKMPQDKPKMLALIDKFLDLPEDTRSIFRLGRRLNLMGELSDLTVPSRVDRVKAIMDQSEIDRSNIDTVCDQLMVRAIPI